LGGAERSDAVAEELGLRPLNDALTQLIVNRGAALAKAGGHRIVLCGLPRQEVVAMDPEERRYREQEDAEG
jgi:hypothetical protein